ncbi:MAG: acetyl-CoA carboxylase biotin carboxyl carrier protein subunit [Achromobacter sp.]|uniref:acetyl-CoA carboxylase biotin carboxyl carrier protein subunit n=1 Tax=Achromobacter sp. TaxID=134375 RepID=UPI003D0812F5
MKKIVSSVAGRVVACCVEEGAQVATGDEAFKVESMKMEIPVESEASGRVARVLVAVGDEVEEGQELALLD